MAAVRKLAQLVLALAGLAALAPARADAPTQEPPPRPAPRTLEARVAGLRARLEATTGRLVELKALAARAATTAPAPASAPEAPRAPAGRDG